MVAPEEESLLVTEKGKSERKMTMPSGIYPQISPAHATLLTPFLSASHANKMIPHLVLFPRRKTKKLMKQYSLVQNNL